MPIRVNEYKIIEEWLIEEVNITDDTLKCLVCIHHV